MWIEAHGDVQCDAYGRPIRFFGTSIDVTERRRVEATHSSAEQRLRTAQRAAGVGIYDWDLVTKEAYWSPELFQLLGLTPGAIEPSPEAWTEALYDESDREAGWGAFRDAVAARRPSVEVEVRIRRPDGRPRWTRLAAEIQYDEAGNVVRVIGGVVDVQVLKEAAAARARALDEAERTSRAKDEFLATMSHELRTPLNAILGWSTMLRADRRDEARLDRGLAVIERSARTQERIVSDLLDVSRIISGKLRLSPRKVELSGLLAAAVDVVRQAADAKGVRLGMDLDPGLGFVVGDSDRLQQIAWNLLSNAVRFTPTGGGVHVTAARSCSTVSFAVQDTGSGIPSEHLPHIFDRFRQVDSSTTRSHGGLGLGLSIVRYLVEAHGGAVTASSDGSGKGATFTVTLPIRAVASEKRRAPDNGQKTEADTAPASGPSSSVPPRANSLSGTRILGVDDDEDSLDLLRVVLEDAGASFTGTTSASLALEAAGRERYDLVVSDIGMPVVDGYSFIRSLRSARCDVPAIALTAFARAEDAERALEAGYQEHISKPVDGSELVAAIHRLASPLRSPD